MRFRGVSVAMMIGTATLLVALEAPNAGAQRPRLGMLRPAPRPNLGFGAPRPRLATLSPHFFSTCFIAPFGFSPFFGGGFPFVNIQIFTSTQPSPDPASHLAPDPGSQPVPSPGSHPLPDVQPVPGLQPVPGALAATSGAAPAFSAPVYSAPVYSAPVYGPATPIATPQVSGGMVVGDIIPDPTFGLWGSSFFFGGGIACVPTRFLNGAVIIR
jgi:hypothetical protein